MGKARQRITDSLVNTLDQEARRFDWELNELETWFSMILFE